MHWHKKNRILGSVRYLVVYDDKNIRSKNSFSSYDVPVVEETESFLDHHQMMKVEMQKKPGNRSLVNNSMYAWSLPFGDKPQPSAMSWIQDPMLKSKQCGVKFI